MAGVVKRQKKKSSRGDIATKRKRKRRRKESAPISESPSRLNSGEEQVAFSFNLGSACTDPVNLIKQKKRKIRKRLQGSQNSLHDCEPVSAEFPSEKEKRSLLAWVEMCMKPEHESMSLKLSEGSDRNGQLVDDGLAGRLASGHAHTHSIQNGDSNGSSMCGPIPAGYDFVAACEPNACTAKACSSNGHHSESCDRARESSGKDGCTCNAHSAVEGELVTPSLEMHTFRTENLVSSQKEADTKLIENDFNSQKNKRKREVDKVLDYVLKRSIVVNTPNRAVTLKFRTTKSVVIAWGRNIPVTLTCEAREIEDWISSQSGDLFGLDVEWRPNRVKGQKNKVALLQLCNGNECLIVQMLFLDRQPQALRELLSDPSKGLAGVGVLADGKRLLHDYGLECQGGIELTTLAVERLKRDELKNVGLKILVQEVLGLALEKPKRVTLSNWAKVKLDPAQINYACMDAWASFALSKALLVQP